MISSIVCDTCKKTLRQGDTGKVEFKTCINCVQAVYPKADPTRIKKPPSISDHVDAIVEKDRQERLKKKGLDSLSVEIENSLLEQDGQILLGLHFTIGKIKKFDLAFTKDQLHAFLDDIERVEVEQLNK